MNGMTIGQLAEKSGIGVESIRFYERRGLIVQPERPGSGFRRYPEDVLSRLQFIRGAKDLGFSLREIAELLALRRHPGDSCQAVREQAETKVGEIDMKIRALQRMRGVLMNLVDSCSGRGLISACPILDSFEKRAGAIAATTLHRKSIKPKGRIA
jgi:MerR family copper efflux transcriptional regulator